jgi:hypothetical protein
LACNAGIIAAERSTVPSILRVELFMVIPPLQIVQRAQERKLASQFGGETAGPPCKASSFRGASQRNRVRYPWEDIS